MIKKLLLIIFGIVLGLLFLEFLFQISSVILNIHTNHKAKLHFENKDKIIISCIGESLTENKYPPILAKMLKDDKIDNVVIVDEGVGGVDSQYLIENLENKVLKSYKPDIIIAMMGLMDESIEFKKIKKIPSKLLSVFFFYKFFNINIFEDVNKYTGIDNSDLNKNLESKDVYHYDEKEIEDNFKIAIKYYNDRKYEKAIELLEQMDFPCDKQKDIISLKIDALKLSGKIKEVQDYVLKKMDEDIMFNLRQEIVIAEETNSKEIAKKLFPMNNKELFKTIVMNSLDCVAKIKMLMKKLNIVDELEELNKIIKNVKNDDISFNSIELNPFSEKAISNYKKLAKICEDNGIQLIVMQYPTLSVLPYKMYLKDFKNIIFVSNEESFNDALKNKKYFDVFIDSFAGKFGHCTKYGNELIAKNLKKVIEKII